MQAVPPMDIYATMWLHLSEETRLKTRTAFLHSDIKIKLSLDAHVHVKTIYIRHTDRR